MGAELHSIKDLKSGFEFLWNANPQVWNRHAPVLFPFVGKLNQNQYSVDGVNYPMGQHGFARDMKFEPIEVYDDLIRFMLQSNDVSLGVYPYEFRFFITYKLASNKLTISYTCLNTGDVNMYFSVGAHPGFMIPGEKLEGCYIEFEKAENLDRYLLKDGLQNGETESIGSNQKIMELNTRLFEKDAIVLKNLKSNWLKLAQKGSQFEVMLNFEGFPFMGIWTKAGQESFICLEPWLGIADSLGFDKDISEKEGIICLGPGSEFNASYSLSFIKA